MQNKLVAAVLFIGSLAFFTWGLQAQEIIGFDARFYLFAQEMLRNGPSWFATTYHQPYPDYTGASTFIIYLIACAAGGLNKLIAVLPTAILAAVTVAFTYLIGALQNRRWGICAAFFLLLTLSFLKSARGIALDMYPTAVTVCCFYLLYSADVDNSPRRVWWIYALLVIGFIFRGPIGLVIPTGVTCIYYLLDGRIKKFFTTGVIAAALLLLCGATLLLLAYADGGMSFVHDVIRMQIAGRIDNHFMPRSFYFTNSMRNYAFSFPACWLVLIGAAYYALRTRETSVDGKLLLKLTGWFLIILLGMSVPDDKKVRYILPMAPAVALIAAYMFVAPFEKKYFDYLRWFFLRLFLILPGLFLLILLLVYFYADQHSLSFDINYATATVFLLAMQISALLFFFYRRTQPEFVLAIAALSFVGANICVIEPIELYLDQGKNFVVRTEAARIQAHARLVFYREDPDGLPIKYLVDMPQAEQPDFAPDQQALEKYPSPAFFVASVEYFTSLPKDVADKFHVLSKDSLGHVKVVVFRN